MKGNNMNMRNRLHCFITALFFSILALNITVYSQTDIGPLPDVPVPLDNPQTQAKIELGKLLFFDARLSGDGNTNCAKCHDPKYGFSNNEELSFGYTSTKHWRHAPSIINGAYNTSFFWDGRAGSLEDQALGPIEAAIEMNQNLVMLEEELRQVPDYVRMFKAIFGTEVTAEGIAKAIAAFERTIISKNSPFDKYTAGDKNALNDKAIKGLGLFKGKANCIRCHKGPNFDDTDFHNTGIPETKMLQTDSGCITARYFFGRGVGVEKLDRDLGRYLITKKDSDKGKFKTPTLRHIDKTPPYMHNGIFYDLEEVVDFYNKGGGDNPNKDKLLVPLGLTDDEKEALVEFLKSLTGEKIVVETPVIPLRK
jgi:cytochrome c peroxidase